MGSLIKICPVCDKPITTEEYFSGENYWCEPCHSDVINRFNNLVDGDAGFTTTGQVDVSLLSLKNLLDMLERQPEMFRWKIDDKKRLEVLSSNKFKMRNKTISESDFYRKVEG